MRNKRKKSKSPKGSVRKGNSKKSRKGNPPRKSKTKRSVFLPIALERRIWALLRDKDPRAVSMKEISESLLLTKGDVRKVRSYLKEQVQIGNLLGFRGSRFAIQGDHDIENAILVTGSLRVYPNGTGNVRDDKGQDHRVPVKGLNGALNGDVVHVRETAIGWTVEEIVEPFVGRLIGRINHTMHSTFFLSEDDRYPWLEMEEEVAVELKQDTWVAVQVDRDPDTLEPIVRLSSVLGTQDDNKEFDKARGMAQLGIDSFPDEVLAESEAVAVDPGEAERRGRLDLREVSLVTIDGPTARDFDDAVALLQRDDGVQRLIVAIADVAHYVRPGTALDNEAARRGTSVYFPSHAIPMLPEALSNRICSLVPHEDRLCMAVFMDYREGRLIHTEVHEGVMRSHARLTYGQVADVLDLPEGEVAEDNPALPFRSMLKELETLARHLRSARMHRGALDFDIPEAEIRFDEEGEVSDVVQASRRFSHKLIEECMLQANEAMAAYLLKHNIPGVYRVHGDPDRKKLMELLDMMGRFGVQTRLGQKLKDHEDVAEESREWAIHPHQLNELFQELEGHELQRVFQQQLLRSMMQAAYEPDNYGHFGLALEKYLHFTSPIRRYPDLCVHRTLKMYLHNALPTGRSKEELEEWLDQKAASSSVREREAMKAEREVVARFKARLMVRRIGEGYEGVITSVLPAGFFVQLEEPFVDGFVHVRQLHGHFAFDEERLSLRNARSGDSFHLGQHIKVSVLNASPSRGTVDFDFVEFVDETPSEEA